MNNLINYCQNNVINTCQLNLEVDEVNEDVTNLNLENHLMIKDLLGNSAISNIVTDSIKDLEKVDVVIISSKHIKDNNNKESININDYVSSVPIFKFMVKFDQLILIIMDNIENNKPIKISGITTEFNLETGLLERIYLKNQLIYSNEIDPEQNKMVLKFLVDRDTIYSIVTDSELNTKYQLNGSVLANSLDLYLLRGLSDLSDILNDSSSKGQLIKIKKVPELYDGRQLIRGFGSNHPVGKPF